MDKPFGKVKVSRLNQAWAEATFIWPGDLKIEGEDETMIIDYLIVWKHLKPIDKDRDPLVWTHISQNLNDVIKKWHMIVDNCFTLQNVRYFSTCMLMIVMDQIWKSNYNVTIMRKYRAVLHKAAQDIENHYSGGFRNSSVIMNYYYNLSILLYFRQVPISSCDIFLFSFTKW